MPPSIGLRLAHARERLAHARETRTAERDARNGAIVRAFDIEQLFVLRKPDPVAFDRQRDFGFAVGVEELEEPAHRFLHSVDVAAAERATEESDALNRSSI